ncbi:WhiB family transcriptional regulator [Corynebacterium guaraldiae]
MYTTPWQAQAKCLGRNPGDYELESTVELRKHWGEEATRAEVAAILCEGCPVVEACAREAYQPLAVGTVRAGVWIPTQKGKLRTQARAALKEIMEGAGTHGAA